MDSNSTKNTVVLYEEVTIQEGGRRLVPKTAKRILDLGGGQGGNGALVKKMTGAEFLCIADLNDEAFAHVSDAVDATAICDINQPGSLEKVFADHGPFDLILCLDVLEHVYDPWRAVARMHALLEPGGLILASIPNAQNYRVFIRSMTGLWRYGSIGLFDRTHIRFFSKKTAIELMTCTGMELVGLEKTFGWFRRDHLANKLSLGLLSPFVTLQNQILVKKVSDEVIDPGFCGSNGPTA